MVVEPILVGDQLLGILLLGHSSPGHFSADERTLCGSVAGQVAQAILNFRHREEESGRRED
jgi:GAF domain-containing protein